MYTYDSLGNLLGESAGNLSKTRTYYATGALKSEASDGITLEYAYDERGLLTGMTETGGIVKSYTYDNLGNRTSFALQVSGATKLNTTYTYDVMNRLHQVYEGGSLTATYAYDTNGNRASLTHANGTESYAYIGAIVGAFIGGGIDHGKQLHNGKTLGTLDWTSIIISAGAGALSGAFGATGIRLLGQIFVNAAISGTEEIVRDVVYGNKIDWEKAAINTGIGALAGGLGGRGLKNVSTVSYGRIVSAGTKMGIYTFTYTSSRMAETMAKEFLKGTVKSTVTVEVINNVVNIMVKER